MTTNETTEDFVAVIEGCTLRGLLRVCGSVLAPEVHPTDPGELEGAAPESEGKDPGEEAFRRTPEPGADQELILEVPFEAPLGSNNSQIVGTYYDPVSGQMQSVNWERLPCRPKLVSDYLTESADIHWAEKYIAEEELIVYTGENLTGVKDAIVRAGVSGYVREVNESVPATITIEITNGNRLVYALLGADSRADVEVGDVVSPDTQIARLQPTKPPVSVFGLPSDSLAFFLKLRAFEAVTDLPISPDCVELGGSGHNISDVDLGL